IDNGLGGHDTESSFNEETRRDWHAWLQAKYETVERLNEFMGTRYWTQIVTRFEEVPTPLRAPTVYNPALLLDWMRFSSDTIVALVKMQAALLHELTPGIPVTNNLRALTPCFDHFDVAHGREFGGVLTHDGRGENRVYKEISHIGDEIKLLGPVLRGTKVVAETCILFSHENEWAMQHGPQPNRYFNQREHNQLFYNALHDRNIPV